MRRILPGLALAVAITIAAIFVADALGALLLRAQGHDAGQAKGSPISAVTIAVLLGLAVGAVVPNREVLKDGTAFAVRRLLRAGIVLVGIRLSFLDVLELGAIGVPFVAVIIATAILLARWLARRLGVSERFGMLTAAATSICGITATLATAPAIDAEEREVAYAVANTTLFGLLAMLLYPWLAHAVFGARSTGAGLFLGTSIHDTSQVVGAALAYRQMFGDELAFKAATVTKLTRNLFIVLVVPLLGWMARRSAIASGAAARPSLSTILPLFVIGFVAMALVRTVGDLMVRTGGSAFGVLDPSSWSALTTLLGSTISGWLLATALAAVGLSVRFSMFRQLGPRPLLLGAVVALAVGAMGMGLALLLPFVDR
ncbi:MAG TPA: putative sulfate exporter family transporter [Thermoanaerobaculia bacterium]|nr:putative sulfate exporter family transporter [Thermoanaerobaculia bacterium]